MCFKIFSESSALPGVSERRLLENSKIHEYGEQGPCQPSQWVLDIIQQSFTCRDGSSACLFEMPQAISRN